MLILRTSFINSQENALKANPTTQITVGRKRKSDASIPQVDGPSDSPPKRMTRSRARISNNNENAPPVKGRKLQEKNNYSSKQSAKKKLDRKKSKVLKQISLGKRDEQVVPETLVRKTVSGCLEIAPCPY